MHFSALGGYIQGSQFGNIMNIAAINNPCSHPGTHNTRFTS